ncbi:MAG: hypothetical protein K2H74_04955 [Paramuribaculum sp.]|nr:hypothetical protein [Paramuribaculum sp.]
MRRILLSIATNIFLMSGFIAYGQNPVTPENSDEEETDVDETLIDEEERDIRENPIIEGDEDDWVIVSPDFINRNKNHIIFNGADWSALRSALAKSASVPFSIVHIGDSHLQADIATGEVRNLLQFDYGNAGRGLITPLKISGTNEPTDFFFTSTNSWTPALLMKSSWPHAMGFSGVSISPGKLSSNFTVATSEKEDINPFSSLIVFHGGQFFVTSVADADGNSIPFVATPSKDYTLIELTQDVTSAQVFFDSAGDLTLYGVSLSGNRPGIFYHTIGNNGAAYCTYNRIGNVGAGINALDPNLVIISLGTNDAFGRFDARALTSEIDKLVSNIRKANPDAQILLVTPMECQKKVVTTVKKKGRGKKKRSRTVKVRGFAVNSNVEKIRDVIMDYGKAHNIAVYDWYTVAGGDGASAKWLNDGLYGHDRVHHTRKGYHLQGELMYEALTDAFRNQ